MLRCSTKKASPERRSLLSKHFVTAHSQQMDRLAAKNRTRQSADEQEIFAELQLGQMRKQGARVPSPITEHADDGNDVQINWKMGRFQQHVENEADSEHEHEHEHHQNEQLDKVYHD
jgi:hypothetical protein